MSNALRANAPCGAASRQQVILLRAALGLLALVLAYCAIFQPYKNGPPIRSDGAGYHVWVYGMANGDLDFCRYDSVIGKTGSISIRDDEAGVCGLKYPPGVAMAQFPFMLPWIGKATPEAFPKQAHLTILFLGAGLLLLTIWFSYLTVRLLGGSPYAAALSIFGYVAGAGLFHISTYDASFSHIYSAFGVSALLYLVTRSERMGWSARSIGVFVLLVIWLYLVRQTNLAITMAIAGIPVLRGRDHIFDVFDAEFVARLKMPLIWLAAALCGIFILLLFNYATQQAWTMSSYAATGSFDFSSPHFFDVLFSYKKGLFTYYPIFLVTLIAGALYFRSWLLLLFVSLITVFAYVYGAWNSWELGGGLGHRGFIELSPLGIVILAIALSRMGTKEFYAATISIVASAYVLTSVMVSYWNNKYPFGGGNVYLYWATILPPTEPYLFAGATHTREHLSQLAYKDARAERSADGWVISLMVENTSTRDIAPKSPRNRNLRFGWRLLDESGSPSGGYDNRVVLLDTIPAGSGTLLKFRIPEEVVGDAAGVEVSTVLEMEFWLHNAGLAPVQILFE